MHYLIKFQNMVWIFISFQGLNTDCVFSIVKIKGKKLSRLHIFTSSFQSFDTKSENLKGKGLKKGLLIVSFNSSSQQFHHDALNAVTEFIKNSPVKVRDNSKMFILFYLDVVLKIENVS